MNPYDDNYDSEFDELFYDDDSIEDITEITPTEFIYCDVYLSNIIENKLEIFNCSFVNFPHIFYSERHLELFLSGQKAITYEQLEMLCLSLQISIHDKF